MKKYCPICNKMVNPETVQKEETYPVFNENIQIQAQVLLCPECGEDLFDQDLDAKNIEKAYTLYRKANHLLFPEKIKQIREKYDLSQRSFAKLLNWSDKTIRRYENGALQNKSKNAQLVLLNKPENMAHYLEENKTGLDPGQLEKLKERVQQLLINQEKQKKEALLSPRSSTAPSIENGFKPFDYEKFKAMTLFFANQTKSLLKTKALKLLFYSDMIHYKIYGQSISGLRYIHLPFGPVPENYDLLFGQLTADGLLYIDIFYEGDFESHQIISQASTDQDTLSPEEIKVLEKIYQNFISFGSREISDYSHKEKGYKMTKQGQVISYTYAKDINLE